MSKHLDIVWTNQFKKDYKLAMKRHLDIELKICKTIPACSATAGICLQRLPLCARAMQGAVKGITLGANVRESLKDGTLNMENMLNHILTMELPNEDVRKDLLRQLEDIRKEMPAPEPQAKFGRNEFCPCGSGKKYKKCCVR